MRTDVIRTYKAVHTWAGLLTGLFLFIAFYAGALAVFEPWLAHWATPPAPERVTKEASTEALIAQILAEHPAVAHHFTIHLGDPESIPARLTWTTGPRDAPEVTGATLGEDGTLEIFAVLQTNLGQFIDDLHRTGGLPLDVELGAAFMGVVSALYALALVSGLIILLPSLIKDLFALRIGPNVKRLWLDAHNLIGLMSLPFHLIIALTSVAFGLHDEIYDLIDRTVYDGRMRTVFFAENPYAAVPRDDAAAPFLSVAQILEKTEQAAPSFTVQGIDFRDLGTNGASAAVWGTDERFLMRGRGVMILNAVTGDVVNTEYMAGQQGTYGAIISSFFALHMATFGGQTAKWGYLVLGLAGAFLFYSGNLLWVESRRRREKRSTGPVRQKPNTQIMAAITVGVALGSLAGVSATIAASKWAAAGDIPLDLALPGTFYTVVVLSLIWALVRGAARASGDLLWLSTLCTALIPLTSVLALAIPPLGLWMWGATWGVDGAAMGASAIFALFAHRTTQRARSGPRDSVWSSQPQRPEATVEEPA